jgi:hypothetical protein
MSTQGITPRLADNLRLLVAGQLQIQAAQSVALDTSALGVMAVNAGVAAIIIGTRGVYDIWIIALALLGLSLGLAVRTLRLPGAEDTGPSIADTLARESNDEQSLEDSLLNDLKKDIETNDQSLARKAPLFNRALTCLVLAILVELAGRAVQ